MCLTLTPNESAKKKFLIKRLTFMLCQSRAIISRDTMFTLNLSYS